jgi:cobalamin synthase
VALAISIACLIPMIVLMPYFLRSRLLLFFLFLVCLVLESIAGYLYGYWMKKRIGGVTGHTLGAVVEQSEVIFLLITSIFLSQIFPGAL